MEEFLRLLRYDASDIENRFKRSSIEGKGTSQEISDFREHSIQSFVSKYYPFPYRISKGGIYDSEGNRSDSIDCLILNPSHPNTVDSQGKHSLIIAEGVDVAIEVKPDIAQRKEIQRGLFQGVSVKKLKRYESVLNERIHSSAFIEHARKIPYFIFSMKAKVNINDTVRDIVTYYVENDIGRNDQFDVIVIFNQGLIVNYKHKDTFIWNTKGFNDEQKEGWFYEEWGENSLAGFLFHLNRVYPAEPRISSPPLSRYINSHKCRIRHIVNAFN